MGKKRPCVSTLVFFLLSHCVLHVSSKRMMDLVLCNGGFLLKKGGERIKRPHTIRETQVVCDGCKETYCDACTTECGACKGVDVCVKCVQKCKTCHTLLCTHANCAPRLCEGCTEAVCGACKIVCERCCLPTCSPCLKTCVICLKKRCLGCMGASQSCTLCQKKDGKKQDVCPTCGMDDPSCPGHPGKITLPRLMCSKCGMDTQNCPGHRLNVNQRKPQRKQGSKRS